MFVDFHDVNTLTTADLKLPIIVELRYYAQKQALLAVRASSNTLQHPSLLIPATCRLNQSLSVLPDSNPLECHIFSTSSRAKWTLNSPINICLYSQHIKITMDRSDGPAYKKYTKLELLCESVFWTTKTTCWCVGMEHFPAENGHFCSAVLWSRS